MNPYQNQDQIFERLLDLIKTYQVEAQTARLVDYQTPEALTALLDLNAPGESFNWDQVFSWVEKYLRYSVRTHHPKFVNRMWSGANLPSIVGEIVSAFTNTSACTFESAPVSTLLEKYMIDEMLALVGFENGEGQMTTGSSNANLIAMLIARDQVNRSIRRQGLFTQQELFALVGADSHYSMDKAATLLGIGSEHLIKIPVNRQGQIDSAMVERSLVEIEKKGGHTFFVGATAGTTVRGAYDSVPDLLQLRKTHHFWLHVDGAWGGAVVLSPSLKERYLEGIAEVDSFTFDFHKMPGTNLICNILLLNNHPHALRQSCSSGDSSYIFRPETEQEDFNLGSFSLQCGRRVDSLKWFLDWKFFGRSGFAARIEHYLQLAEYAEQVIHATDELELVVPRSAFNVCFRFKPSAGIAVNDFNLRLRTRLYQQATTLVGYGYIGPDLCLRLLITHPASSKEHVDSFFKDVLRTGHMLMEES